MTDRQPFIAAFQQPTPPVRRSRWLPYIAVVVTVTLLAVVGFGLLWLYGSDPR
jgi:hypothetical protein